MAMRALTAQPDHAVSAWVPRRGLASWEIGELASGRTFDSGNICSLYVQLKIVIVRIIARMDGGRKQNHADIVRAPAAWLRLTVVRPLRCVCAARPIECDNGLTVKS